MGASRSSEEYPTPGSRNKSLRLYNRPVAVLNPSGSGFKPLEVVPDSPEIDFDRLEVVCSSSAACFKRFATVADSLADRCKKLEAVADSSASDFNRVEVA
jgi:hypothetical protein